MGAGTASRAEAGVHLLGIRHHGPGSARSLGRALDELRPDLILLEAPPEAEAVLDLAADPDMRPPVALLGYAVEHPERAAFLPFATFSPEWVAVRWAQRRRVPVRGIDLPLAVTLAGTRADADAAGDEVAGGGPDRGPVDPLALLAEAAGEDDPERWWEDVIEHRGGEPAFTVVADAMAAVRATAPPPSVAEQRREAAMRAGLRRARADGAERVAVVCGAWHVPALAEPLPHASHDAAVLRGLRKVKVAVTWVPWTQQRLATAGGYGAGVGSPAWYAHVFEHPGPAGVTRWFVDAARLLRGVDHDVSPDHVIAATRLAHATAALRGRPQPGLVEVLDATTAVLAEGRGGPLALVRDRLVIGDRLGNVPDRTPMVPLARDVTAAQRRLRLRPDASARTVELDVRTTLGRDRSHLLHRLAALDVPWGRLEQGRGSSGTFRETWRLQWEPELSVRLVDASAYGTTVEAAATARLVERAGAASQLLALADVLERALLAELPGAVRPAAAALAAHAAHDPDVASLVDALDPLARALRYGDVRATDRSSLADVVDGIVVRVLAGLVPACASLDEGAALAMAERLTSCQAALGLLHHQARHRGWPAVLARLADRPGINGLLQGRATRLLHDAEHLDAGQVERRLSRALSVGTPPADGAAFVEGFLAGSGTVLLHDASLLRVIDAWLAGLDGDGFVGVVALLRRTFATFEPGERRRLGALVAGSAEARPRAPFGWDLDPGRVAAAVATARSMLGAGQP